MNTDDMIERLVQDGDHGWRLSVWRSLTVALVVGGLLAFVLLLMTLRLRPDWAEAIGMPMVWVKMGFTLSLAAAGLVAVRRLSTPGDRGVGCCSFRCHADPVGRGLRLRLRHDLERMRIAHCHALGTNFRLCAVGHAAVGRDATDDRRWRGRFVFRCHGRERLWAALPRGIACLCRNLVRAWHSHTYPHRLADRPACLDLVAELVVDSP